MPNKDNPLSFEEFSAVPPDSFHGNRFNNLPLYFLDHRAGAVHRNKPHFINFQGDHSNLEKQTTRIITETMTYSGDAWDTSSSREIIIKALYPAYLILRTYVESDHQIFG